MRNFFWLQLQEKNGKYKKTQFIFKIDTNQTAGLFTFSVIDDVM